MHRFDPADFKKQRRISAVLLVALVLLLLGLAGRVVFINTSMREKLVDIVSRQQAGHRRIPARRGMIVDARGRVLATTRIKHNVFVDPSLVDDIDALAGKLSSIVDKPRAEIARRIRQRSGTRYVSIATLVDDVTASALRDLKEHAVGLTEQPQRVYPLGSLFTQIVGIVGSDHKGLEGLELAWDEHLKGQDGQLATICDARRRPIFRSPELAFAPRDGSHLVLTIDAEIQRLTEAALAEQIQAYEADSGVAIVMSPLTGDVLAMVSLPTCDPDDHDPQSVPYRRNRAVTDPVEPGSTFKPIIACGAIDGGFMSTTEHIHCHNGRLTLGRRVIVDDKPAGDLDLTGIITKSSNIGMTLISQRMGHDAMYQTLRRFGFGELTRLGHPGASAGLVRSPDRWTKDSGPSISFGYEILVTPIQLINAFGAIINDGVLLKPRLVKQVLASNGALTQSFEEPEAVRRATSVEAARFMTFTALRSVVANGSTAKAEVGGVKMLGKTGTTKLIRKDGKGYADGQYLSTFIGAAPAQHPTMVALVMVRRPNPALGYYGSLVSAPAVGRILAESLAYLEAQGSIDSASLASMRNRQRSQCVADFSAPGT